jgi:hypothetical protein
MLKASLKILYVIFRDPFSEDHPKLADERFEFIPQFPTSRCEEDKNSPAVFRVVGSTKETYPLHPIQVASKGSALQTELLCKIFDIDPILLP